MGIDQIRELREAAKSLLEWVPVCSPGSSGYMRIERLHRAVQAIPPCAIAADATEL